MKRLINLFACCLTCLASGSHAEPAHKGTAKVDMEAAAKATAALYATPPVSQKSASPAAQKALPAVALPARPVRNSPLLPAAAAEPTAVVTESPAVVQQAAGEVWAGAYQCEHSEKVSLRPGAATDQVELQWKAQRWQMRRIDSRSGAMRLEDASARMVWIQLANKSMLLDQRQGKRLLDECQHDVQVQTAAQMKNNPPPALFDTTGMGR